jgi:hypothetical protein
LGNSQEVLHLKAKLASVRQCYLHREEIGTDSDALIYEIPNFPFMSFQTLDATVGYFNQPLCLQNAYVGLGNLQLHVQLSSLLIRYRSGDFGSRRVNCTADPTERVQRLRGANPSQEKLALVCRNTRDRAWRDGSHCWNGREECEWIVVHRITAAG